ncbi:MAG TPA: Ig-like domain-containing protein [Thermoanaerobaculia bacterium]|nr:Ig-like domain-containing protein [Thermoanaerobaculia bacterium]
MNHRVPFLLAALACTTFVQGQQTQLSPGVGNAVLLARNSVQVDNTVTIVSGDVIVNDATVGPVLGELALSLDRAVITPAGYKIAGTSIDLDSGAVVGGDAYYNALTNQGTIAGTQFSPLALPVFAGFPPALARPPGSGNVTVAANTSLTLGEGAYGNLTINKGATLLLSGGGYAFQSITVASGGSIRYAAHADIVVSGRADFGANDVVSPADGSGLTPAAMRIQVDGINGTTGVLGATPPSIHVGQSSKISATLYATAGSLILDQSVEGNGAFVGRDILVGHNSKLTLNSAYNQPPSANAQVVFTTGSDPLPITLTGTDPEGGTLTFSIVSAPHAGTLSAPVSASPTSANVTYTPSAANVADSFTFRVTDPAGATGDAVVTINPTAQEPPPPPPTTVIATDSSAQTAQDVAATLTLSGTPPAGVALTFSIVPSTGPFHGSLGAVSQGTEVPERSATVVYTPDAGYTGPDSFQFQACGTIASVNTCDAASFSITVGTAPSDPPSIAHDVQVSTFANTSVLVSLGDSSITTASRHFIIKPMAATLQPVAIAGNVADSNGDQLGDNVNALPGPAPVFMSAGVNQGGTAGSGGTTRMQFEWDMTGISGSLSNLQSADVILPTNRGTVDSLDTFFYAAGVSGDGLLTNSDFEAPAEQIPGVVMPVPPSMPIGSDGTFSFSVLGPIHTAAQNGFSFFAIQGRVNESLTGPARGLQVRTTADGNISSGNIPKLSLTTPGVTAPLTYRITSLPTSGVLRDSANALITTVPYDLPSAQVSYTPNTGFLGTDTFSFSVSNGVTTSNALGTISVFIPNCQTNPAGCNDGR